MLRPQDHTLRVIQVPAHLLPATERSSLITPNCSLASHSYHNFLFCFLYSTYYLKLSSRSASPPPTHTHKLHESRHLAFLHLYLQHPGQCSAQNSSLINFCWIKEYPLRVLVWIKWDSYIFRVFQKVWHIKTQYFKLWLSYLVLSGWANLLIQKIWMK